MNRLADMHEAPALRRWAVRLGLALVVAIAIGYLPGGLLRRDPRALKLEAQLEDLDGQARTLEAGNAALVRDIEALRTDVHAIEERARADLGMVYPDEIVLRVVHEDPR
ncbi:MAG: FtsB family cell division protein [Acidobacteriota bacterium]